MEKKLFSYKEASVWKRSFFSVKEVLLWTFLLWEESSSGKKFYHEKEVLLWNKFYYEKEIQQWKNISTEKRKISYGKITSSWSKLIFLKERVLLWEGRFFWKESSIIRRSSIVEKEFYWKKEVLLEKIGSHMTRKSQWKRSSFWEGSLTEILLWDCCSFVAKRSSIMRRKFGYGTRFILRTKSYYGRYFYYKKEVLLWEGNNIMFQEILSCQGSSIVEKEFFYEKETLY